MTRRGARILIALVMASFIALVLTSGHGYWSLPWLADVAYSVLLVSLAGGFGFGLGHALAYEAMVRAQDVAADIAGQRDRLAALLLLAGELVDEEADAAERVTDADLGPIFTRLLGALRAEGGPLSEAAHGMAMAGPSTPVRGDAEREAGQHDPGQGGP